MEGVDAVGTVATEFVSPIVLKEGDLVQIRIGEKDAT
jgi:hypothetical protein